MTLSPLAVDALILGAGIAAGFINAIAGGASLIGLPVLVAFGIPPTVANASNNVATTVQSLTAAWAYARQGYMHWRTLALLLPPVLAGSFVGARIVVELDQRTFSRVVAALMLVALGLIVFVRPPSGAPHRRRPWWVQGMGVAVFAGLGVYGGFFGGGLGLVVLPTLALVFGLDLVTANGVKSGLGFAMNSTAFVVFWAYDLIAWRPAAALTAGMVLGSLLGVRTAVRHGAGWVRGALIIITVVAAIYFWMR